MSPHPPRARGHVTATGIRIVGAAAAELAAQAEALGLEPPPATDLVWAARFRVRPRLGKGSPVPAVLAVLETALREQWDACPALTRESRVSRPSGRFHGLAWDTIGEPGAWRGELTWRHAHPALAGTACTTHAVVDEQQHQVTLTLAVAAEGGVRGVRGIVGAGQSRPPLLDALRKAVVLSADGSEGAPTVLSEGEVTDWVRDVLLSDGRTWPVAVLAPMEQGGYLVPPEDVANELFGLAPLYVLERHACTFRLTDAVGDRRLSAYWGALRVYRADFSCADRSDDHWLLMRDRVEDPLERAAMRGRVALATLERHLPIEGIRARREAMAAREAASVAAPAPAGANAGAEHPDIPPAGETAGPTPAPVAFDALSALPGTMDALLAQLRELSTTIAHLGATNAQLADEIARLRTTTAIRAGGEAALDRRLAAIERHLGAHELEEALGGADAESPGDSTPELDDDTPTLVDVVQHAGTEYGDALLVLDSAERAAADSPYLDPERVGTILQAMAYISRRRQEGGLEAGLRGAFKELGIDYRSRVAKSTSGQLLQQYRFIGPDGSSYDCHEHIAVGGTYDPRRCLRIYFTSRAAGEPRFVIGHVGRHLVNMTSS